MIVSIHQPDYIPYIGYFYKIFRSDKFVFLDDAQYSNDNMHQWNRIKTPQGELRLKIPVEHHFGDKICEVRTKDELNWKDKHLKNIEMNYGKCPYFNEIFPTFQSKLSANYSNLAEMNIEMNRWICESFSFQTEFYMASQMDVYSKKEERVIELCSLLGAHEYISGNGAKAYQHDENFRAKGIQLTYTDYHPVAYRQRWKGFTPNLSILDYIFNNGFDFSAAIQFEKDH